MTSLPFIKRKSFIDILTHIKPQFYATYIKDVVSKHALHRQSITFYRIDFLGKCFQNIVIMIHVWPSLTHVYCLKAWRQLISQFMWMIYLYFFVFRHTHKHTSTHSGAARIFIDTLRERLISVWCLPRSDIIEMPARVARLPRTGTSPTPHIS